MKAAASLCAAFALVSASTPFVDAPPGAVALIQCSGRLGTAFWIGPTRVLTAAHVVSHEACLIDGAPVTVVSEDDTADIAELRSPAPQPFMAHRCEPYRIGGTYRAIGFVLGQYRANIPWLATGQTDRDSGQYDFIGEAQPGMSGGPILDSQGRVVGIVNQRYPARSRALKDTSLC